LFPHTGAVPEYLQVWPSGDAAVWLHTLIPVEVGMQTASPPPESLPPQHSSAVTHGSPCTRQPLPCAHARAPVGVSTQSCVQQSVHTPHGSPSALHIDIVGVQVPGVVASPEHLCEQQSVSP
jgi:hypothetical protein